MDEIPDEVERNENPVTRTHGSRRLTAASETDPDTTAALGAGRF